MANLAIRHAHAHARVWRPCGWTITLQKSGNWHRLRLGSPDVGAYPGRYRRRAVQPRPFQSTRVSVSAHMSVTHFISAGSLPDGAYFDRAERAAAAGAID